MNKLLSFEFSPLKMSYMENEWMTWVVGYFYVTCTEEYVWRLHNYVLQKINCKCWSYETCHILSLKTIRYLYHEMSQDWVNNYPDIGSAATRLTSLYLLSVFTLFVPCIADGAWSRSRTWSHRPKSVFPNMNH